MKVEGQCHCGAIVFEAEIDPHAVAICHCSDCQQLSGSAFRVNVPAAAANFKLIKGEPRRYAKVADSGARRLQAFCEHCGSPIYSCAADSPTTYTLRVGTLKQRAELGRPARQIWTRSRLSWVPGIPGTQEAAGQR